MSGHSKWNNIKRKKEKTDGQRAKVFTKIARELAVAVKEGVMGGTGDECTAEQYEKRNWGAIHLHPLKARELIREGAEKALRRFKEDPGSFQPMKIEPPYTYCVTFRPDKDHKEPRVVHCETSDCLPEILR